MTGPGVAYRNATFIRSADAALLFNQLLAQSYESLVDGLAGSGAMAGTDDCGKKFAEAYNEPARETLKAFADVVAAAGGLAQLIEASATNYRRANRASFPHTDGVLWDGADELPEDRTVRVAAYRPPDALGGDGAGPDWWHWVADKLGGLLYPDADTDRLRSTASAWGGAAMGIEFYILPTMSLVEAEIGSQDVPEAALARAACATLGQQVSALVRAMEDLEQACEGFAEDVDHHRQRMEDELASFIKWTVAIQAVVWGLTPFTLGASQVGQLGQAAKVASAVAKVRNILGSLAIATAARLGPIARTAGSVRAISVQVGPLSTAAARMAQVRAVGAFGEKAAGITKNTRRIASTTRPGRYRIPDQLDDAAKVIGEVKNVKYQGLSSQLQDFLAYKNAHPGWTFVLYVRQSTVLSGPLQELVRNGDIVLRRVL